MRSHITFRRAAAGCLLSWAIAPGASAATFWTGPPVSFAKASFADPTLPENQDRITSHVFITRGSNQGLFNAALEGAYLPDESPVNTEWAVGTIAAGVEDLAFSDWRTAVNANPPAAVGVPYVLHILDVDIYIDVTMTSWGIGGTNGPGGAFSYVRSTPAAVVPGAMPAPLLIGLLGLALRSLRTAC